MQRSWTRIGLGVAAFTVVCLSARASSTASVNGLVRDARGAAQIGAMVQVLADGSNAVATAFTDLYGRYRIGNLPAGRYQVRATATMFLPTTRWNLRLATGMRATVNLTMSMIADPAVWLPATRRAPSEPGDDWAWTLRSAPDRPILRVLSNGSVVLADIDGDGEQAQSPRIQMRAGLTGGNAGFGASGVHGVIALDRVAASGSDIVLQADMGVPDAAFHDAPQLNGASGEVAAGFQRTNPLGASRVVMTAASHPELAVPGSDTGMQWMRMASAQKMQFGDAAEVEAGGTVYAIHANGYALSTRPFLRVTVHPGQVWAVRYRLATSREVQAYDSLDAVGGDVPIAARIGNRMTTADGMHQEIAVTRKIGDGTMRLTVYHDQREHAAIAGTGAAGLADGGGTASVVDTATGDFRMLAAGYTAKGLSIALAQPVGSNMWASVAYASGRGLAVGPDGENIVAASAALHPVSASATTAELDGRIARTHTKVSTSYRWQPHRVVTAVDAYAPGSEQSYLSLYVRQAISLGNLLPQGLEATVDVTNLLAEGYHPFLSADGRTLYLAQAPRTVKAGLAFNF
ncbi:MAG TPA: carboxypeptidase-like regulatory domain-containing protein [Acidobacteriaceae bacterium]|nr:carboxypeptidase-like regulatory domain-containing protein [Acidobacteriaceae bacterium]